VKRVGNIDWMYEAAFIELFLPWMLSAPAAAKW
jgi:hypothetical protein